MVDIERSGEVFAGKYRVESMLGEGGMGSVYAATQLSVNRRVAIKVISASSQNADFVRRFRREAEAMAQLNDPHSVRLFDFGVNDAGEFYIVMEMLEGEDLSARLRREGTLPVQLVLTLVMQILHSLDEAHARGIVHRDLKPANVFLARMHGGQISVKVLDFGIAAIEQQLGGDGTLTRPGMTLGTPAYMSPEQARASTVDARSDLYSLGVVMFEMLTGRLPFSGETPMMLMVEHIRTEPPKLQQVRPMLAKVPGLQSLLDGLLAKEPHERPPTAHAVADLITRMQSSDVVAAPVSTIKVVQAVRSDPLLAPPDASRLDAGPSRAKLMWGVAVGLVALTGSALAYVAFVPSREDSHARVVGQRVQEQTRREEPAPVERREPLVPRIEDHVAPPTPPKGDISAMKQKRTKTVPRVEPQPVAVPTPSVVTSAPSPTPPPIVTPAPAPVVRTHAVPGCAGGPWASLPAPRKSFVGRVFGRGDDYERRAEMMRVGPSCRSVAAAKHALRTRLIDETSYEDTIWTLKQKRAHDLREAEADLSLGALSKQQYEARVAEIERAYSGS